jgi:hypothetical protein
VSDWLVDQATDPRAFPTVRHRHPNGTMDAVHDQTPTSIEALGGGPPLQRWTYVCPCGGMWTMERRR